MSYSTMRRPGLLCTRQQLERVPEATVLDTEGQQRLTPGDPHGSDVANHEAGPMTQPAQYDRVAGAGMPGPDATANGSPSADGEVGEPGPDHIHERCQVLRVHRRVAVQHGDQLGPCREHPGMDRGAVARPCLVNDLCAQLGRDVGGRVARSVVDDDDLDALGYPRNNGRQRPRLVPARDDQGASSVHADHAIERSAGIGSMRSYGFLTAELLDVRRRSRT
jgi:hypothetical protein